jgi:hypothetical protein
MPSTSGLESDADLVRRNANDPELKKLAETVSELCRKVEQLEDEVNRLKR